MNPLLTHDQLVDWLIYHCPLMESDADIADIPFMISYQGQEWRCDFTKYGNNPLGMYNSMADDIMRMSKRIHQEITDLYWYWTL